jgi:hypothetical protein
MRKKKKTTTTINGQVKGTDVALCAVLHRDV